MVILTWSKNFRNFYFYIQIYLSIPFTWYQRRRQGHPAPAPYLPARFRSGWRPPPAAGPRLWRLPAGWVDSRRRQSRYTPADHSHTKIIKMCLILLGFEPLTHKIVIKWKLGPEIFWEKDQVSIFYFLTFNLCKIFFLGYFISIAKYFTCKDCKSFINPF